MYISNMTLSDMNGAKMKKKTIKRKTPKHKKKIPINPIIHESSKSQLIGLPYDRKTHVQSLLKQIDEKILDFVFDSIRTEGKYYYQEFSKEDFDKIFFKEKNLFSVLNSLSDREISNIYDSLKVKIDKEILKITQLNANIPKKLQEEDLVIKVWSSINEDYLKDYNAKLKSRGLPILILNPKYNNLREILPPNKILSAQRDIDDLDAIKEHYRFNKLTALSESETNKLKDVIIEHVLFSRSYLIYNTELEKFKKLFPSTEESKKIKLKPIKFSNPKDIIIDVLELKSERDIINSLDDEVQLEMKAIPIEKDLEGQIHATAKDFGFGYGFFDNLKNIFTNSFSASLDKVQKTYYPLIITKIQIYRTPVEKVPLALLKLLSAGNFDYKSVYDQLFHLYCVFELANETRTGFLYQLTEKNPNIVWESRSNLISTAQNAQSVLFDVQSASKNIVRFGDMIKVLKANVGKQLYDYNAAQNNCQLYILNLIKATCAIISVPVPKNLTDFIYQDLSGVLPSTSTSSKIANAVTDTAHVLNRVKTALTGKGKDRKKLRSRDGKKVGKGLIGLYNKSEYDNSDDKVNKDNDLKDLKGSNLISRNEIISKRLQSKIDSKIDKVL